jgi:hypothetical protein
LPRWITCVLTFKERSRDVFAPNRYSKLFFLDEATSLAAGHRPCAECRRARYEEFRAAWSLGAGPGTAREFLRADEIDRVLHSERWASSSGKKTYRAVLSGLPDGTIVEHASVPHLVWGGMLRPWSFFGYGPALEASQATEITVLTPRSIVLAIRAGFTPQVHPSAGRP